VVYIVGIGPGSKEYILPQAIKVLESSDEIIGFGRAINSLDFIDSKKVKVNKISEVIEYLDANKHKNIAVSASGDPLFYGITNYLKSNYDGEINIVPGITSFQYLAAKLNKPWQNAFLGSLHGREQSFIKGVLENNLSIWLTDNKNSPEVLAKTLLENGLNPYIYVGENLSYEDERIESGTAEDIRNKEFKGLSIMIVEREEVNIKDKELHFIKDDELIRGNCPMTKEEIRILSIAKLNLREDSYVLDVGAGTGSISVQAAKFCPLGKVVAIEKDEDAVDTIKKNVTKFKLNNLELIEGEAMEVINNINYSFDSIFIGGSGGNIEDIIKEYGKKLMPGGKLILNFITINNLYKAMDALKKLGYKVSCTQVSISKTKGESYMLFGNNPIFIIEGEK